MEKIGALGPATGPKELTFFPIGFNKICIYHRKQLKIPRRWGAIAPRNISGKKDIDENTWNYEKSLRGSQGSQGPNIKDRPTVSSKSLVGLSNMWEQKKSVIYPKPKKKWEKNWKLRTIFMGHPVYIWLESTCPFHAYPSIFASLSRLFLLTFPVYRASFPRL